MNKSIQKILVILSYLVLFFASANMLVISFVSVGDIEQINLIMLILSQVMLLVSAKFIRKLIIRKYKSLSFYLYKVLVGFGLYASSVFGSVLLLAMMDRIIINLFDYRLNILFYSEIYFGFIILSMSIVFAFLIKKSMYTTSDKVCNK
jgi:hypothetical protein